MNVAFQEKAVHSVECQQAKQTDACAHVFFPPGDNHSDHDAERKEEQTDPLFWPDLLWLKSNKEQSDYSDAQKAPGSRDPTEADS